MGSTISDGPASDTELCFILISFFVNITNKTFHVWSCIGSQNMVNREFLEHN